MPKKEKSLFRQLLEERGIKDLAGVDALVKELTSDFIQGHVRGVQSFELERVSILLNVMFNLKCRGKSKVLIAADKITKSYSDKALLNETSFYLYEWDKVGIIGINGAGKSTLLRIVAQLETPDSGIVTKHDSVRIGYLSQVPILNEESTVLEQVLAGASDEQKELQEYEAKTILNKLGITEFDKKIAYLSGGQKKRVAMAGVLVTPSEVLILDEPTNHLDNDMISWLENYLIKYTGAVLMVTHDRYFLDRVVSKIVEIDRGSVYEYEANYSRYLELKAQREELEVSSERKRKSLLRKELEWISRGAKARTTKSKSRIERFEGLNEKNGPTATQKLSLSSVSTRMGKKTIEINAISKSFGDKQFVNKFEHIIARDARIGIVGKNGCGKSTLLNMISGRLLPDSGEIVFGETIKIGYFTQECKDTDLSIRVIDYIKSFAENIITVEGTLSAAQMLEKFLFPPDMQWNTIGRLSGGERRRLLLLGIIMGAPNILLLDEPTNDLDIETLIILEEYLENFSGAVVAVSHDRYFLDKVVDLIFEFQTDGTIKKHFGGYSNLLTEQIVDSVKQKSDKKKQPPIKRRDDCASQKVRFSFKEQREYGTIDGEIALIEQKLDEIEKDMFTQASNYEGLQQLLTLKEELDQELNEKTERWFYLHELADKIAEQVDGSD